MIARIWTTDIDPSQAEAYENFARAISLPMFRAQTGYRGVLMGRKGAQCVVVSLWEDGAAITALDGSPSYQATVMRIMEAGFLGTAQTVSAFDLHEADIAF